MNPRRVPMKIVRRIFAFLFLISFCCTNVSGQQRYIQMLTPHVGWAFLGGRLFWTTSAGGQWKDITPAAASPEVIASFCFLDTSTGWVLLAGADGDNTRFDLASTTNAGESWSIKPVRIPNLDQLAYPITGGAHIDFVDSLHGWMNLGLQSSVAFHSGIQFVTQDGAKSWHALSLEAPPELPRPVRPNYALPTFDDRKRGFLLVSYLGPETPTLTLVLFGSDDGGQTWKPNRVLPGLAANGFMAPSTVSQSYLITAAVSDHKLTLTTVAPGHKTSATGTASNTSADVGNFPYASGVDELSFVDSERGWVLNRESTCGPNTGCGTLLATTDGGRTWAEVTPGPKRIHLPEVKAPSPIPPVESKPLAQGIGL